eukprot:3109836-Amphidinium_carterae.2
MACGSTDSPCSAAVAMLGWSCAVHGLLASWLLACWAHSAEGKDIPLVIFGKRKHRFRFMDDDIVAGHSRVNGQNAIAMPDKRGWVKLDGHIGDRPQQ